MQIFADIFNILTTNINQDAASLGAFALVSYGLGIWDIFDKIDQLHQLSNMKKTNQENYKKYKELFKVFKRFSSDLANIGDRLFDLD